MFSNGSFPNANLIYVLNGGLYDTISQVSSCDVSYCNISQTPCIFTCSNVPYYGFTMSLLYFGDDAQIINMPFLIYGNITYPVKDFRMFTPDWAQDMMYEDFGELWQRCNEFDYIPEVDSEGSLKFGHYKILNLVTCTNFTSNTLVYKDQQLLFNYSINVYYHDPDRIMVTTEQKFSTTGYVILDTPNYYGPS
uniref:Uncharacterized protein n=1 Tax=Acrobeloides nanus TaxID=290746 RepID=A0A914EFY4_9BILA